MNRADCAALDDGDPLKAHRAAFDLPADLVYLDGNSLGALPRATGARLREVIEREWGDGLIRSWNAAGWIDLPRRVGARIARLVGAQPHEVTCADSTSINLFKVLAAALRLQTRRATARPVRNVILSERGNFPTDLYVAQGLADLLGADHELRLVEFGDVARAIDKRTAVVMLTHVNFRTGAMHDLADITRKAHAAGALTVWDLAHSAGAVPVALNEADADFAVGCGYKYLNGGPGAPAFVYAASRHLSSLSEDRFAQPLSGWLGHQDPFAFDADYAPAPSIDRFSVGTPSILALAALDIGVETVLAAGVDALRAKSTALTKLFIELVGQQCRGQGIGLVTPRDPAARGSQVSLRHAHAFPVMQALIARGVIGDFRAPDVLRFGFAPLYVRHVDVWDAAHALAEILANGDWQRPEFQRKGTVT
jgi:kynureninase